jgi:hypothetical protein
MRISDFEVGDVYWVAPWISLFSRQVQNRDWAGARESVDQLNSISAFDETELDPVSEAFERLFTGRVEWTPENTIDLHRKLSHRRRTRKP